MGFCTYPKSRGRGPDPGPGNRPYLGPVFGRSGLPCTYIRPIYRALDLALFWAYPWIWGIWAISRDIGYLAYMGLYRAK